MRRSLTAVVLLLSLVRQFTAQPVSAYGREFYTAFGPNQGASESETTMSVFCFSKYAAHITVEVPALSFSKTLIIVPNMRAEITLPSDITKPKHTIECTTPFKVLPGMAVHITSDSDIQIVALNSKQYSEDNWSIYPTSSLGKEYYSLNYGSIPAESALAHSTAGTIVIVGTEDNTSVRIEPTDHTEDSTAITTTDIILSKGEVYLLRGDTTIGTNDITGTHILADKPIAVLSGHKRTEVPTAFKNINSQSSSRDCLYEQLPSVDTWDSSIYVVPFKSASLPEVVRVLSASNNNIIAINGTVVDTIQRGKFYEINKLTNALNITGSEPILVGQYMHSSVYGTSGGSGQPYGDPSLLIAQPLTASADPIIIMDGASIANIVAENQYITIISTTAGIETATLDSEPVVSKQIGVIDADHAYYTFKVGPGAHVLHCVEPVSVSSYGFSPVSSYAYSLPLGAPAVINTVTPKPVSSYLEEAIGQIVPNPVLTAAHIEIPVRAHSDVSISWSLVSIDGKAISCGVQNNVSGSQTNLRVPAPVSAGTYTILLEIEDQHTHAHASVIRSVVIQ